MFVKITVLLNLLIVYFHKMDRFMFDEDVIPSVFFRQIDEPSAESEEVLPEFSYNIHVRSEVGIPTALFYHFANI